MHLAAALGFFPFSWLILMHMDERSVVLYYSSAAINTDMNGRVCGALIQFDCYQHRHE